MTEVGRRAYPAVAGMVALADLEEMRSRIRRKGRSMAIYRTNAARKLKAK